MSPGMHVVSSLLTIIMTKTGTMNPKIVPSASGNQQLKN